MNNLKLKMKHDKSHEWIVMPIHWFLGVLEALNLKKTGIKKELKPLNVLKTKNALHIQPFLCLNPQNNQFKKKT